MTKLSETQAILLTAAAERAAGNLLPRPARCGAVPRPRWSPRCSPAGWSRSRSWRTPPKPTPRSTRSGATPTTDAASCCASRRPVSTHSASSQGRRRKPKPRSGPERARQTHQPRGVPWARRRPKAPQQVTQRRCGARPASERTPGGRLAQVLRPRPGRGSERPVQTDEAGRTLERPGEGAAEHGDGPAGDGSHGDIHGHEHRGQRRGLAAAGDPRCQRGGGRGHDRLRRRLRRRGGGRHPADQRPDRDHRRADHRRRRRA